MWTGNDLSTNCFFKNKQWCLKLSSSPLSLPPSFPLFLPPSLPPSLKLLLSPSPPESSPPSSLPPACSPSLSRYRGLPQQFPASVFSLPACLPLCVCARACASVCVRLLCTVKNTAHVLCMDVTATLFSLIFDRQARCPAHHMTPSILLLLAHFIGDIHPTWYNQSTESMR